MDTLDAALRDLPSESELRTIAATGRRASLQLLSEKGTTCYAVLAAAAYARSQKHIIREALARRASWQVLRLDPWGEVRCPRSQDEETADTWWVSTEHAVQ